MGINYETTDFKIKYFDHIGKLYKESLIKDYQLEFKQFIEMGITAESIP